MHQAGPNKPIYNDAWKHKKIKNLNLYTTQQIKIRQNSSVSLKKLETATTMLKQSDTGQDIKSTITVIGTKRYYDGKIKTMRLAGHVECIAEVRNALNVSVWTSECKRSLARPKSKRQYNFKTKLSQIE